MKIISQKQLTGMPLGISGFLLLFPACYFIGAALLKYNLGIPFFFDPIDPWYINDPFRWAGMLADLFILGGPVAFLAFNLYHAMEFQLFFKEGKLKADISLSLGRAQLLLTTLSIVICVIIGGYFIMENLHHLQS